ncbi:MAG: hypothetical protein HUU20_02735 [Pirellulales bacterium]|nr:hypothetical protein [Pirellulales bacterium]
MEIQLEGVIRASRFDPRAQGKQFLGAAIGCSDGSVWVIDDSEQSPFHAFAARQVVVSGEPCNPPGQHLIGWPGAKQPGHFRVSTMRPVEVAPDLELVEVGSGRSVRGRFDRGTSDSGESILSFVSESGDAFLVVNDPAGATVGRGVEVWAYPVQPSVQRPGGQYLWIIPPCSAADLWEWRRRRS